MIKWFVYIVLLLIFVPRVSPAKMIGNSHDIAVYTTNLHTSVGVNPADTILVKTLKQKQLELEDKKKIKEVTKAKRQPKPEKVDEEGQVPDAKPKTKPKRQRRPEGLERPPEIPRRNGN